MRPPASDIGASLLSLVTDHEQVEHNLDVDLPLPLASAAAGADVDGGEVPQRMLSATLLDRAGEAALGRAIRENREEIRRGLSGVPIAVRSVLRTLEEAKAGSRPLTDALVSPFAGPAGNSEPGDGPATGNESRRSAATNLKASAALQGLYDKWSRAHQRDPLGHVTDAAAQRLAAAFRQLPLASVALKEALDVCTSLDEQVRAVERRTATFHADILCHRPSAETDDRHGSAAAPAPRPAESTETPALATAHTELMALQREAGIDLTTLREACRAGSAAYSHYAKARQRLVEANLRLAFSMANKLRNRNVSFDDLFQEATIGIMRAAEKFDERRGYKFSTYAVQWIRQALFRCFADTSRTVRLPAHMHEKTLQLKKLIRRLESELGREPTMAELATASDSPLEAVEMALRGMQRAASLDAPVAGYEGLSLLDAVVTDHKEDDLAEQADADRITGMAQALLKKLPPRESLVVRLRHGIGCAEPQTLEKIGAVLGVTRERARQLEARAMQTLRDHARPDARDASVESQRPVDD